MPYPNDPEKYPAEFSMIFRKALGDEEFALDCSSRSEAINLRHRLHAFRRAMEDAKVPGWSELRKVEIHLVGTRLIAKKEDLSGRIRASLGKSPTALSEEEINKYLRATEEARNEGT